MNTSMPQFRPSGPGLLLRLEGALMLAAMIGLYVHLRFSGWLFALLFLVPDIAFALVFLAPGKGHVIYNALHTYLGPGALALIGLLVGWGPALPIAMIWAAHIGWDRMVGYGLKYNLDKGQNHIQRA